MDNEIYSISNIGLKKLTDNTWEDEHPIWSPDGKKIAFTANPEGNYDIFTMNADGSNITQLTSFPLDENWATWFPDGKSIIFTRQIKKFLRKSVQVYRMNLLTQKIERIIPQYSKGLVIPHLSPKASLLTFTGKRTIGWDVAVFDMNKNELKFLDEGGKSCRARFSKDGKKLAYVSSKADKKGDIWLMNPDGSEKTRLTKRDDTYDYFPSWSPDNNYIVFNSSHQHDHNGDWKLYIVEVKSSDLFLLFDSPGNDVFPDWR
jgi:Tol biopolymer transport system component